MARASQSSDKLWQRKAGRIRFRDDDTDFYFLIPLAFQIERGSAIGECFDVASRIKEGDPTSWAQEWAGYAERIEAIAEQCEQQQARISAGEAYLRAFTYYRTAIMGQQPSQHNSRITYERMVRCFRKAVNLLGLSVEPVNVPYGEIMLSGYFMKGAGQGPRPTVITTHGGEMVAEELYFWIGAAGMRRGYNVLSIDAPGVVGARVLHQNINILPFFQERIRTLVDYALSRPETKRDSVAVMGFSGGGYLGMRLAAIDTRVQAMIASAPIYDLHQLAVAEFPVVFQKAPTLVSDALLKIASNLKPFTKVALERVLWAAGVGHMSELLEVMKQSGPVDPASIQCPMLCAVAEGESLHQHEQAKYVYERLTNPQKAMHIFTSSEGADAHCQCNNLLRFQQISYDWLDSIFSPYSPSKDS